MKQTNYELVGASLAAWSKQIEQAWHGIHSIELLPKLALCNQVVICGMGGSALGAEVVVKAMSPKTTLPIYFCRQSFLPNWVNKKTLIVLVSYSGTTAEVLTCANEAKRKNLLVVVITKGGDLAKLANKNKWPMYQFVAQFNPAGEPRFGLGYMGGSIMALGQRLAWWQITEAEKKEVAQVLAKPAKDIAPSFKELLIISEEWLSGAAHAVCNQVNETAKIMSWSAILSELNHHLLEGASGGQVKSNYQVAMAESKLVPTDLQKRTRLTKQVFQKQGYRVISKKLVSRSLLAQAWELAAWGGYLSLAAAKKNKQNPLLIE
ncbi:MAG: SIS domain-containing protein [Candidatus Komeilibacteria bacterium]|nr:SIS domain-containing protein [Candidatus Komeilibacteria bacterium]